MPIKIFFCYAHEDEPLLNQLKIQLKPLERQGLIQLWYDRIMRNDFYNQLAHYGVLAERLEKLGLLNIPPYLQDIELTAIIRRPAEAVGLSFEDGLIEVAGLKYLLSKR